MTRHPAGDLPADAVSPLPLLLPVASALAGSCDLATPTLPDRETCRAYLQVGSPSPAAATSGLVVLTPIPQLKPASWLCVFVASQAPEKVEIVGMATPVDGLNF